MRVIAGKYRGKKLKEFDIETTRPTIDRVKEAMFSVIQFDVPNAIVLDLFSGTGALGIEAISRGAKKTYLIDNEKKAVDLIRANLKGMTGDYEVCCQDFMSFLSSHKNLKFNIILIDAPFNSPHAKTAIDYIIEKNMLAPNGVIVLEKSRDSVFNFDNENFEQKVKNYGQIEVRFLRKLN